METRKLILAIDFNNCMFTSYYGQQLINSKGHNINAIRGFFHKLKNLKDTFNPSYIVFASDLSREKTFRRKLFKKYKAQRKPIDQDIVFQMKYASTLISLLGYQIINNEEYEADDILGMISKYGTEHDMDTVIISSDKDLYQLINNNTFIMSPRSNNEIIDTAYMIEKYRLTPDQWIDLKILKGDNSDNIPGIPGIGELTALKLMNQHGSIENIYKHIKEIKGSVQKYLINGRDSIDLTRKLVTIITDYNLINFDENKLIRHEEYGNEIMEILNELEANSLINIFNYNLLSEPVVGFKYNQLPFME